ncbi:unnamed protein product, partial [Timema podura]|nr:unnamed protein product [Timema podura]
FQYVAQPKKKELIAFGSKLERRVLSSDVTRFSRQHTPELLHNITPNMYNLKKINSAFYPIISKVTSRKGVGGVAQTAIRFKPQISTTPAPTTYDVTRFPLTSHNMNKYPFNSSKPRVMVVCDNNPGPGTYHVNSKRDRRIEFEHSFGGRKTLRPAVPIKCVPSKSSIICGECGMALKGDYWEHRDRTLLCPSCMVSLRTIQDKNTKRKLLNFKKVRECSFIHHHENTTAAIILMDSKSLRRLQNKEAYFQEYFQC